MIDQQARASQALLDSSNGSYFDAGASDAANHPNLFSRERLRFGLIAQCIYLVMRFVRQNKLAPHVNAHECTAFGAASHRMMQSAGAVTDISDKGLGSGRLGSQG